MENEKCRGNTRLLGRVPIAFLFLADLRVAVTRYDNTVLVFYFLNEGLFATMTDCFHWESTDVNLFILLDVDSCLIDIITL